MTVSAIAGKQTTAVRSLVDLRNQLNELQRQLSTGQKSTTYAGLGVDRGVTIGLRSQLSAIASFDNTAEQVQNRIAIAQTSLGRMSDISNSIRNSMMQGSFGSDAVGANIAQSTAQFSLDEMLTLLNTRSGDRYLFSGRATDQPAVESYDHIINGNGAQAGLKQIISERAQADLGASGLGRLTVTPTGTTLAVAEDVVSPFGFKLASISSLLTNATVSGPGGGPPPEVSVDMTAGVPNVGDSLTLRFTLPDGTMENLTLTATATAPPGPNQFLIGANASTTTANLSTALTSAIETLAATSLKAASAAQASSEFFSADASTPPPRVDGPPFDSAIAMTTGTSADTVIWYTGETGTDSARSTATARIDPALVVGYGMRANETGFRTIVENLATLAAVTVSASDPNAADLSAALNQRLTTNLSGSAGVQSVADIQTDLAGAQISVKAAQTRHQQQNATMLDFLQAIEGVSNEAVGAQILTLQTRLQASMQVTALMYQTSLVNYM
jgi:flagellin-like hook-associated protein FlgL